jgi:hypothetical protein
MWATKARSPISLAASRKAVKHCVTMWASSVTLGNHEQLSDASN